jgi:glutamate/aspartate transport system substrate-binding protein
MFRFAAALIFACTLTLSPAYSQSKPPSDSRLASIVANNVVRVAYRANARPFSFLNERQEPVGYTIDLCRQAVKSIAQQFGLRDVRIEWVQVDAQNRFAAIAENRADMECGSSTVTLSRMKDVDFSSVIFVESTGVAVARAAGIRAFEDLAGKRIAVIPGTTNERAIRDQLRLRGMNATVMPVREGEGLLAVEEGRADAFASDKLLLMGSRSGRPEALAMLPDDLSIEPYAIVLPRGDWAFRLAVNTGLSQAIRGGAAGEILKSWFAQVGLRPGPLLDAAFAFGGLAD